MKEIFATKKKLIIAIAAVILCLVIGMVGVLCLTSREKKTVDSTDKDKIEVEVDDKQDTVQEEQQEEEQEEENKDGKITEGLYIADGENSAVKETSGKITDGQYSGWYEKSYMTDIWGERLVVGEASITNQFVIGSKYRQYTWYGFDIVFQNDVPALTLWTGGYPIFVKGSSVTAGDGATLKKADLDILTADGKSVLGTQLKKNVAYTFKIRIHRDDLENGSFGIGIAGSGKFYIGNPYFEGDGTDKVDLSQASVSNTGNASTSTGSSNNTSVSTNVSSQNLYIANGESASIAETSGKLTSGTYKGWYQKNYMSDAWGERLLVGEASIANQFVIGSIYRQFNYYGFDIVFQNDVPNLTFWTGGYPIFVDGTSVSAGDGATFKSQDLYITTKDGKSALGTQLKKNVAYTFRVRIQKDNPDNGAFGIAIPGNGKFLIGNPKLIKGSVPTPQPATPEVQKVRTMTVSASSVSLNVGGDKIVTASLTENGQAVSANMNWRSSNVNVATVTNGKIVAVGEGTATITVSTVYDSQTFSKTIAVTVVAQGAEIVPDNLVLVKDNLYIADGDSASISETSGKVTSGTYAGWYQKNYMSDAWGERLVVGGADIENAFEVGPEYRKFDYYGFDIVFKNDVPAMTIWTGGYAITVNGSNVTAGSGATFQNGDLDITTADGTSVLGTQLVKDVVYTFKIRIQKDDLDNGSFGLAVPGEGTFYIGNPYLMVKEIVKVSDNLYVANGENASISETSGKVTSGTYAGWYQKNYMSDAWGERLVVGGPEITSPFVIANKYRQYDYYGFDIVFQNDVPNLTIWTGGKAIFVNGADIAVEGGAAFNTGDLDITTADGTSVLGTQLVKDVVYTFRIRVQKTTEAFGIAVPGSGTFYIGNAYFQSGDMANFALNIKETLKLSVKNVSNAEWTSSDASIATVENGLITGVKPGTVTITATKGSASVSCQVTVSGILQEGLYIADGESASINETSGKLTSGEYTDWYLKNCMSDIWGERLVVGEASINSPFVIGQKYREYNYYGFSVVFQNDVPALTIWTGGYPIFVNGTSVTAGDGATFQSGDLDITTADGTSVLGTQLVKDVVYNFKIRIQKDNPDNGAFGLGVANNGGTFYIGDPYFVK